MTGNKAVYFSIAFYFFRRTCTYIRFAKCQDIKLFIYVDFNICVSDYKGSSDSPFIVPKLNSQSTDFIKLFRLTAGSECLN